jgi:pimeloyl-ACP methyl ester carboxylesterase
MNSASRRMPLSDEPFAPRSLGTLAAALVTCTHPRSSRIRAALDLGPDETGIYWCAACGALCPQDPDAPWQAPSLTSAFRRKSFEDLVLLLHAVAQLAQLAQSHGSSAAVGSPAHIFLRNVSRSLSELARLPVVRDVDRLEKVLAKIPTLPICP